MPNTKNLRADLTADYVRSLLSYDPVTGIFHWLVSRGDSLVVKAGDIAGTPQGEGYVQIGIDGVQYLAHRLAWLYMTDEWPKGKLDHRDRVRSNNVWTNIRAASNAQNSINSIRKARDLPRGVYRHRKKFIAGTTRRDQEKKGVRIGSFDTPEAAHQAWLDYMVEHHGKDFIPEMEASK